MVNAEIAKSAIQAFSRHQWYLMSEMISLALFIGQVPMSERRCLADALMKIKSANQLQASQSRYDSGLGKPKFSPAVTLSTRLCNLVDIDSRFAIYRLKINRTLLHLPVTLWGTNEDYLVSE